MIFFHIQLHSAMLTLLIARVKHKVHGYLIIASIHGLRTPNEAFHYVPVDHGLRTPGEGLNQRYLKNWADVADKICFGRT